MRNILIVSIDCFRYDRCGFNDHHRNTTPFLDKIAGESLVFDNAFATGPYTTESVPGFIAGQHSYNGCYFNSSAWKAIPENSETLASFLKRNGFDTRAVLSNPHLTAERNFDAGFDVFRNLETTGKDPKKDADDDGHGRSITPSTHDIKTRMQSYNSLFTPYTPPYVAHRLYQYWTGWASHRAKRVLDEFLDEIKDASEPLFGWTHLMDLHAPIHPDVGNSSTLRNLLRDTERVTGLDSDGYRRLYDDALEYVDYQLSEFIDNLTDCGMWDDTTLIITADHGENLYDRNGLYGHPRHHHYDELLHVPLLVRTPDGPSRRITHPFSLAWLHEVIADCASISEGDFPANSGSDGLLDGNPPSEFVVTDTVDENGHTITVRDSTWKYLRHDVSPPDDFWYPFGDDERAYRYVSDRGERRPDAGRQVPNLKSRAEEHLVDPSELSRVDGEFTADVKEQLTNLGYRM